MFICVKVRETECAFMQLSVKVLQIIKTQNKKIKIHSEELYFVFNDFE